MEDRIERQHASMDQTDLLFNFVSVVVRFFSSPLKKVAADEAIGFGLIDAGLVVDTQCRKDNKDIHNVIKRNQEPAKHSKHLNWSHRLFIYTKGAGRRSDDESAS
jgi:hypothetical protein